MQQQLIDSKRKQSEEEARVRELQSKLKLQELKPNSDKEIINLDETEDTNSSITNEVTTSEVVANSVILKEKDAKLVGIISAFLNVHPFGAGLDYIWSYVSKMESNLRPSDIELLMSKFPTVFKQELVGIGANIERKWLFNAFNNNS